MIGGLVCINVWAAFFCCLNVTADKREQTRRMTDEAVHQPMNPEDYRCEELSVVRPCIIEANWQLAS